MGAGVGSGGEGGQDGYPMEVSEEVEQEIAEHIAEEIAELFGNLDGMEMERLRDIFFLGRAEEDSEEDSEEHSEEISEEDSEEYSEDYNDYSEGSQEFSGDDDVMGGWPAVVARRSSEPAPDIMSDMRRRLMGRDEVNVITCIIIDDL
jgi:hypothetical protein